MSYPPPPHSWTLNVWNRPKSHRDFTWFSSKILQCQIRYPPIHVRWMFEIVQKSMLILLDFPVKFCSVRSAPSSCALNVWNRLKSYGDVTCFSSQILQCQIRPPPIHGRWMFETVQKAMVILLDFPVKFCSVISVPPPLHGRWMFEIVQHFWALKSFFFIFQNFES